MSNVANSGEEHSIMWGMFMNATLNAATFMSKNFTPTQIAVENSDDLELKGMFDISANLVNEQKEITGISKICWGDDSWRQFSLIEE